jgi:hypothetical protein
VSCGLDSWRPPQFQRRNLTCAFSELSQWPPHASPIKETEAFAL